MVSVMMMMMVTLGERGRGERVKEGEMKREREGEMKREKERFYTRVLATLQSRVDAAVPFWRGHALRRDGVNMGDPALRRDWVTLQHY